ncbi:hypothetical protein L208DRAFT_1373938 [Tricholoma matsutake]|nr:hypothetical protein L208DRAFT_1373938 [Tricholoma matsutake 945]
MEAVQKLEKMQPLVALCAPNWKVEHVLNNTLLAAHDSIANDSSDDASQGDTAPSSCSNKKKNKDKRKKTKKKKDDDAMSITGSILPCKYLILYICSGSVGFITVNMSFISLKCTFLDDFPSIPRATDLLSTMEENVAFKRGPTLMLTMDFLSQVENADPYVADLSEDDSGPSWGHSQFTSGNMTLTSVLQSWESIGSTETACRLIAASIKTCKITTGSYLSDAYLQNLIEVLWTLWKKAGGVRWTVF